MDNVSDAGPDADQAVPGRPRHDPDDHRLPVRRGRPLPRRRRAPGARAQGAARRTRTRSSGCRTSCPRTARRTCPTLIVINYLLERDRLTQVTPNLTADDRHHAKTQLESRRSALTATLREALRRAYGVISATDDDLGPRAAEQVLTLARDLDLRIQGGQGMRTAFDGCC